MSYPALDQKSNKGLVLSYSVAVIKCPQQQHGAAGPNLTSTEHGTHTNAQLALSVMRTSGSPAHVS